MPDTGLHYLALTELAALLRARTVSPLEVTMALLDRIDSIDGDLGSYARVMRESALDQARVAEKEILGGDYRGPLHGVPVGVKDLCATAGTVTGCGSRILAAQVPDHDATVVSRLKTAGAVILGKLTMTEFAGAGYHPDATAPVNPWDTQRWPGLSSSGSGAATAAGLCYAATATDTGGSIRLPSGSCGVVGIKPTYGRVSRHGVFPLCDTLDHVGPIARSVGDAAIVLEALAGRDPLDATSLVEQVEVYGAGVGTGLSNIRIGIDESYCAAATDPEVSRAVGDAVRLLGTLGADIREISMPSLTDALSAWLTIFSAEAFAVHERWYAERPQDYGPSFRVYLDSGSRLGAHDYAKAHIVRLGLRRSLDEVFRDVDMIACPACAVPAQRLTERAVEDGLAMPSIAFTAPYNLTGSPAITLPSGFSSEGLPLSLQLIGRDLGEMGLVKAASAYEQATDWHLRHPEI